MLDHVRSSFGGAAFVPFQTELRMNELHRELHHPPMPSCVSYNPRGVEGAASHAHHPHAFTKTCLPLHDDSGDHSIYL